MKVNFRIYNRENDSMTYNTNEIKGDCILMQGTGFFDSHNKEIFEGDIVKESKDGYYSLYQIYYDDDLQQFEACEISGNQTKSHKLTNYDNWEEVFGEIKGNMYQNLASEF